MKDERIETTFPVEAIHESPLRETPLRDAIQKHRDKTLELYQVTDTMLEIKAFQQEIASFSFARTSGISCRSVKGRKLGMAFTEKKDPAALEQIIHESTAYAGYLPDDEGNGIYESSEQFQTERFYNPGLAQVPLERKKQLALEMEALAYDCDPRIVNVPETVYYESTVEVNLVNSYGLAKGSRTNYGVALVYVIASDGVNTEVGTWAQFCRDFESFDPRAITRNAVDIALSFLDAVPIKSGNYPAIFSAEAASDLLGALVGSPESPFFGENIQKKISKLEGKMGTQIAAPKVTIIDDPGSGGFYSQEFDDEGVPMGKRYLVRNGIFETALYNIYSAKREHKQSTGHGLRESYTGRIHTAPTNLYLAPGNINEDQLLRQMGAGIYISSLDGLDSGLNPISGEISLEAKGFRVENGSKTTPLQNFIVAGNFYDLMMRLVDQANNLRNDSISQFSAPSIFIESLAISGK